MHFESVDPARQFLRFRCGRKYYKISAPFRWTKNQENARNLCTSQYLTTSKCKPDTKSAEEDQSPHSVGGERQLSQTLECIRVRRLPYYKRVENNMKTLTLVVMTWCCTCLNNYLPAKASFKYLQVVQAGTGRGFSNYAIGNYAMQLRQTVGLNVLPISVFSYRL